MVGTILQSGVAAADPERLVADALRRGQIPLDFDRIIVLAVGKAARGMATGALAVLGERMSGVAVCSTPGQLPGLDVMTGDHPIPGAASFAAGHRLLRAASAARRDDLVLVLLSGGASAMAESPAAGVSKSDIIESARSLIASGQPIANVNEQRGRLSGIKNGGLTAAARPAAVVTLAISDVDPEAPEVIGSGPSIGSDMFLVLADGSTAARAMREACRVEGLATPGPTERLTGPAAAAGRRIAGAVRNLGPGTALIGSGETTVRVGRPAHGGRNQELALAAALEIGGSRALIGALGTDGIDGPTANAGAIVDGTTVTRAVAAGLDAAGLLDSHNSATLLEATGDVIVTGPTGTNVGDLVLALMPPDGRADISATHH